MDYPLQGQNKSLCSPLCDWIGMAKPGLESGPGFFTLKNIFFQSFWVVPFSLVSGTQKQPNNARFAGGGSDWAASAA
jgi:hypothetical protein